MNNYEPRREHGSGWKFEIRVSRSRALPTRSFLSFQDLPRVKTLSSGFLPHGVLSPVSLPARALDRLEGMHETVVVPVRLRGPFRNLALVTGRRYAALKVFRRVRNAREPADTRYLVDGNVRPLIENGLGTCTSCVRGCGWTQTRTRFQAVSFRITERWMTYEFIWRPMGV